MNRDPRDRSCPPIRTNDSICWALLPEATDAHRNARIGTRASRLGRPGSTLKPPPPTTEKANKTCRFCFDFGRCTVLSCQFIDVPSSNLLTRTVLAVILSPRNLLNCVDVIQSMPMSSIHFSFPVSYQAVINYSGVASSISDVQVDQLLTEKWPLANWKGLGKSREPRGQITTTLSRERRPIVLETLRRSQPSTSCALSFTGNTSFVV